MIFSHLNGRKRAKSRPPFLFSLTSQKGKILGNLFIFYKSEKSLKVTHPRGTSGIKGSNWFRQWWNCSKHIIVKRLANKTTHRCGSSGKDKQPSESI